MFKIINNPKKVKRVEELPHFPFVTRSNHGDITLYFEEYNKTFRCVNLEDGTAYSNTFNSKQDVLDIINHHQEEIVDVELILK